MWPTYNPGPPRPRIALPVWMLALLYLASPQIFGDQIAWSSKHGYYSNTLNGGNVPRKGEWHVSAEADNSNARPADTDADSAQYVDPTGLGFTKECKRDGYKYLGVVARALISWEGGKWKPGATIDHDGNPATPPQWVSSYARVKEERKLKIEEEARAIAISRDPYYYPGADQDRVLQTTAMFGTGTEIGAIVDEEGESAGASLIAGGWTDLNDMGDLWALTWHTDGLNPGVSFVDFWSHPALGLDDEAIRAQFMANVVGDPLTGQCLLASDFSFCYELVIPANSEPRFSEASNPCAWAAMVPEPPSIALLALGGLGALRRRRVTRL